MYSDGNLSFSEQIEGSRFLLLGSRLLLWCTAAERIKWALSLHLLLLRHASHLSTAHHAGLLLTHHVGLHSHLHATAKLLLLLGYTCLEELLLLRLLEAATTLELLLIHHLLLRAGHHLRLEDRIGHEFGLLLDLLLSIHGLLREWIRHRLLLVCTAEEIVVVVRNSRRLLTLRHVTAEQVHQIGHGIIRLLRRSGTTLRLCIIKAEVEIVLLFFLFAVGDY